MKNWFRPAGRRSAKNNVTRTLLQSAVFWGLFLWLIPIAIHNLESALDWAALRFDRQVTTGWILFAMCGSLGISSGVTLAVQGAGTPLPMDTARKLVIRGPFRYVRNPMAVAGIGQGIAVGVVLGSGLVIAYSLAGAVIWHVAVRPHEEADLLDRFAEDYRRYRDSTNLWIPK